MTAVIGLITLNLVCRNAMPRGWLAANSVAGVEPGEKRRWTPGRVGILEGRIWRRCWSAQVPIDHCSRCWPTPGCGSGEALGLTWADVDFERHVIRVHRQLSRCREHARLKTDAANREMLLAPAIVRLLREEWVASPFKSADDFVFTTRTGRGLGYRQVGAAFRTAVQRAGVQGAGRLSFTRCAMATRRC